MNYSFWIFLAISCAANAKVAPPLNPPKLLVLSYDGFKNEYFNRAETTFLRMLRESGINADHMISSFVTKTLPNHHTIATGLHPETHGLIDSEVWDEVAQKMIKRNTYELYHYNNDTMPIWILNEIAGRGRRSGVLWPGGQFEYHGITATFAVQWNGSVPMEKRLDELMSWYVHPETPINLAMMYIEKPDMRGHAMGYHSDQFDEGLKEANDVTLYVHKKMKEYNLNDLNVVYVGDHGMATVKMGRIVNLTDFVDPKDYMVVGQSPMMNIYPLLGKENSVYNKLKKGAELTKKFKVYRKLEIPERYHYSNNPRVGPILILAKTGYVFDNFYKSIQKYEKLFKFTANEKSEFGLHGYDNEDPEMYTMFFGTGPAFMPCCTVPPFENVDLFPLFCDILDIPCTKNNGTMGHFPRCLTKYDLHRLR